MSALRPECAPPGGGNGRVYAVTFEVSDTSGPVA